MAAVKNTKNLAAWSKGLEVETVVYDFTKDAGATGVLDLFTAKQAMVIHKIAAKVIVAGTSGGAATVEVGVAGNTAGLMAQTAVASLTLNAVIDSKIGGFQVANAAVVQQKIATAALTAGKIQYEIWYTAFGG